jgi:acyl-CoA reductase-like NAD-dependent aldehyde dehydrogenase
MSTRTETDVGLVVGGEAVETADTSAVHDPAAPGEVVGHAVATTRARSEAAVRAAHEAWRDWTQLDPPNWPLAILAASLPYALVAGNAVIVKPPPTTPLAMVHRLHRQHRRRADDDDDGRRDDDPRHARAGQRRPGDRGGVASYLTAGQVCMGIKRLYVHRSRSNEVVEAGAAGHEVRELGAIAEKSVAAGGWFLRPGLVLDPAPTAGS